MVIKRKIFQAGNQEIYLFALPHLLLCSIKVIVNINASQELCNGIFVGILLLLDDLDKFLELRPSPFIDYECSCKIAQKMWCMSLNSVEVPVQEQFVCLKKAIR